MKGCDVHAVLFDRRPRGALERLTKVCLFPSQGCDEEEDAMERERASTTARYRGREFHDRVQRATYLPPLLGHDDGSDGMPLSLSSIRTVHLLRERSSRAFAIGRCTAASRRTRRRASPRRQAGRLGVATPPSVLLQPSTSDEADVASPPRLTSNFLASRAPRNFLDRRLRDEY